MILDTDVWSRLARRHPSDDQLRQTFQAYIRQGHKVFFSAIVVYELSQWLLSLKGGQRHSDYVQNLMGLKFRFPVLDLNEGDADQAARFAMGLRVMGQTVEPGDCLIAGQAAARNLPLVTFNLKHYRRFVALDRDALDLREPNTFEPDIYW